MNARPACLVGGAAFGLGFDSRLFSQAHRINDETLRALVAELDLSEVPLRKRLAVARRALGLPEGGVRR